MKESEVIINSTLRMLNDECPECFDKMQFIKGVIGGILPKDQQHMSCGKCGGKFYVRVKRN